jgi:hypothetical protein
MDVAWMTNAASISAVIARLSQVDRALRRNRQSASMRRPERIKVSILKGFFKEGA